MTERIEFLDTFRGLAVALMVFWQVADFLGEFNLYKDWPFFLSFLNAPIHFPVFIFFLAASGAGLYLSFTSRRKKEKIGRIGLHYLWRYGSLIPISLIFTTLTYDFCTFFGWEEAIQGIGLTALVTFLLLLFVKSRVILFSLAALLFIFGPFMRNFSYATYQHYPKCSFSAISLLSNLSFRGFFSVFNLLPLALIGILLLQAIMEKKVHAYTLLLFGAILIFVNLLVGITFKLDFYQRTTSLIEIGITLIALGLIISKNFSQLFKPLSRFGKFALPLYLSQFAFFFKPAKVFGFVNSLSNLQALLISLTFLVFAYKTFGFFEKRKVSSLHIALFILLIIPIFHLLQLQQEEKIIAIGVDVEPDFIPYLNTTFGITSGIPKILEIFDKYKVKATFFVVGEVAKKYPNTIKEIAKRGHEIGSHSYRHENFSQLSLEEKISSIKDSTTLLENLAGQKIFSFRTPYNYLDRDIPEILENFDYRIDATYDGEVYPHKVSGKVLRLTSRPLFYPSAIFPNDWVEIYHRTLALQKDFKRKFVSINFHSWEVLPLVEGYGVYSSASGNYTLKNLIHLLEFLKKENVDFITAKEASNLYT